MAGYVQGSNVTGIFFNSQRIIEGWCNGEKIYSLTDAYKPFDPIQFNASDNFQEWIVPNNVTKVHVVAVASRGQTSSGFSNWNNTMNAGKGGKVECDMEVTPNQTLYCMVGKIPSDPRIPSYNATDIRTDNSGITNNSSLMTRLIVAGGGGNGAVAPVQHKNNGTQYGGNGGGTVGASGTGSNPASGGTQTDGGISSTGNTTTKGKRGLGGERVDSYPYYSQNGAGGAGYFGGGGGQSGDYISGHAHAYCTAGGGGSSYPPTDNGICTNVIHNQGFNNGNGYIIISPCKVTVKVTPTPSDATVTLTSDSQTVTGTGEQTITVYQGALVRFNVSKIDYVTQFGSILADDDKNRNVTLAEVVPVGTVIFESGTAGNYTVTIPIDGSYRIDMCGGGGRGGKALNLKGTGGSAAYIYGTTEISQGQYSITVGYSSSNSSFLGNIAGGGMNADRIRPGAGGTAVVVSEGLVGSDGTSGSTTSRILSYGGGGYGEVNGQNGYIKIVRA